MGELKVRKFLDKNDKAHYIKHLLTDIEALTLMLKEDLFERKPIRIGAEQEFCLVDEQWEPAKKALEILESLNDEHFTTEIAQYNLEANLDPITLQGDCFSQMHRQLIALLEKADAAARQHHSKIVLTGILPTIQSEHGGIAYMTPIKRYRILNETITEIRKRDIELHIKGVDELNFLHDSILFEGCNTSFQCHLQIDPDDFIPSYNWSQAISAPILAAATNSPLLLGRELWSETRIALFAQSVNTRKKTFILNENEIRVGFGDDWFYDTVINIFKDNIMGYRSLITSDYKTDSLTALKNGNIPELKALNLHNGTVYRWNRPCYGVGGGKPHLRIENRYIPSGPSTSDEIANMMFWVGVMRGRPEKYDQVHNIMHFKDVKTNFFNAARYGMATQFYWDDKLISSHKLILDELLPMAYKGLYSMQVKPEDAEHYLSIIENRIKSQSGSRWMAKSYRNLSKQYKKTDALRMLTAAIYKNQEKGYPISTWKTLNANTEIKIEKEEVIGQYMNTGVVTVQEDDSAALALAMMQWKDIHHLPVVNNESELVGLLTWTDVKAYLGRPEKVMETVGEVMRTALYTSTADTGVKTAKQLMEQHQIHCLPVVEGKKLIGIITSKDI